MATNQMKKLAYCLSWVFFVSIAQAEPKPLIIGTISYLDKTRIVVADRKFTLPTSYQVQTQHGNKLSSASLQLNQVVAIYAQAATPFSQPVVNKIVLRRKP